jgi:hypothetical protein
MAIFFDNPNIKRIKMRKFFLALFDHERGQVSGVNRRIANAGHDVRNAAGVVEVTVSNNNRPDFIFAFF